MAVSVMDNFVTAPWVGLCCVILAFAGHTHLLFDGFIWQYESFV